MAGSAAYEGGDFRGAARYWQQLLALLPAESGERAELAAAIARAVQRAKFSLPAAGSFSNVGRNAFNGPSGFNMNLTVSKRFYLPFSHQLEVRMDATNFTNTPTFNLPTATTTNTAFGRIGTSVYSYSRKLQLGVKYIF